MGVNVVIILTLLPALALLPKARAGCNNSARPDPCGGPPARAVPTATYSNFEFSNTEFAKIFHFKLSPRRPPRLRGEPLTRSEVPVLPAATRRQLWRNSEWVMPSWQEWQR